MLAPKLQDISYNEREIINCKIDEFISVLGGDILREIDFLKSGLSNSFDINLPSNSNFLISLNSFKEETIKAIKILDKGNPVFDVLSGINELTNGVVKLNDLSYGGKLNNLNKMLKNFKERQILLNKFFITFKTSVVEELRAFGEFLPENEKNLIKNKDKLSGKELFELFFHIKESKLLENEMVESILYIILIYGILNILEKGDHNKIIFFSLYVVILLQIGDLLKKQNEVSFFGKSIFGLELSKKLVKNYSKSKVKNKIDGINNKEKQFFMGKLTLRFPELFVGEGVKYEKLFDYILELGLNNEEINSIENFLSKPSIANISSDTLIFIIKDNLNNLSNLNNIDPKVLQNSINTLSKVKHIILNKTTDIKPKEIDKSKVLKPEKIDINNDLISIFGEEGYLELSSFNSIIIENKKHILKIGQLLTQNKDRDYFCSNFEKLIYSFNDNVGEQLNNIFSILSFFNEYGIRIDLIQDIMLTKLDHNNILRLHSIDFSNIYLSEDFKLSIILFCENGCENIIKSLLNSSKNQDNLIIKKQNNELDEIIYGIIKNGNDEQINSLEHIIDHMLNQINKRFSPSKFTSTNSSQSNENFKGTGTYCTKFKLYLNQLKNKSIIEMLSVNWQNMFSNTDIKDNQEINFIHQITTSNFNKSIPLIESLFYLGEIMEYVNKHDLNRGITELIDGYYEIINGEIELADRKIRQIA